VHNGLSTEADGLLTKVQATGVRICLEHYKNQVTSHPSGAGAGSSVNAGAGPFPASAGPLDSAGAGCRSCPMYRQLLSNVLQDILKFQNFASVMSTSSENLFHLGQRRASTFNLLHEAAVLKETAGVRPLAKAETAIHIAAVIRNASSELKRLQDFPVSSYKWSWGETLIEKDVLNLRRTGTQPGCVQHSGYDLSLGDGRMLGEDSSGPSSKTLPTVQYDDIPEDSEASFVPQTIE
jgi:hypothetical protein